MNSLIPRGCPQGSKIRYANISSRRSSLSTSVITLNGLHLTSPSPSRPSSLHELPRVYNHRDVFNRAVSLTRFVTASSVSSTAIVQVDDEDRPEHNTCEPLTHSHFPHSYFPHSHFNLSEKWFRIAALAATAALCFALLPVSTNTTTSSFSFAALTVSTSHTGSAAASMSMAIKSAWAGLAAGCLHTLAGADHLAALTPLTIGRSHLKASLLGALWGFGHSTGQLILGLLMVILKDRFTALVPALSKWGGTTVGLTLLAIGAIGIYESFFEQHNEDEEEEEEEKMKSVKSAADAFTSGVEVHASGILGARQERRGFGLATFATGIIYGLQPDALFVIIPALALPTKLAATAYILMFVVGTVAAMGAYTGVIGATSAAIKKSNSGLTKKLSGAAALVAIAIGVGVLASGWGIELPFGLSSLLGGGD